MWFSTNQQNIDFLSNSQTKSLFLDYVKKNPNVLFQSCTLKTCPLALFLTDFYKAPIAISYAYVWLTDNIIHPLEDWMAEIRKLVDSYFPKNKTYPLKDLLPLLGKQ